MRTTIYTLVLLFLVIQVRFSSTDMDAQGLSREIIKFSAKFCNELNKNASVISSPLSAEYLLALLALGTSDTAHSELLTSLGIPDDDSIRSSFSSVSSKLKSIKGVTLNVANNVYIMEGDYDLVPELKKDAITVFDAGIEKINFSNGAAAATHINQWVEDKTNKKIKDLLSSDSLNSDTRLVLVNALYFKGTWEKQFEKHLTSDQPFNVNNNTKINVPMMFREDTFWYGESEGLQAQLLKMNYVGNEASMLVVLPNEIEGLGGLLQKLADGYDLLKDVNQMYSTKVRVTLPKFKIETEIDLNTLLPKLGIKQIFNQQNSGLTKVLNAPEPLYVSKAIQKAFIEVNEEGAEAAAATVMGVMMCSAMLDEPPVPNFCADRPFLAVIFVDNVPFFYTTIFGLEE
ncbi:antichymotrypsin-2-like isoform X2 [Galleria mellonella]|uniref:Antichymotrypsin-2-like isoform X2 n=1 Tax=Galleria mellonella TaxID=7137 RepID=A0ABM3MQY8_GALME|nr:antichymotrypsin-2-like isoform X2 [Galleria mellonella]